ncbi:ubiquitin domain-containing protein DSK2a-like isoform X1 [Raphanus sativus]|uniref:Ubiquilin n=2 Tax=Raphanus sativus TaxID=3726 RepID=A0A6J0KXH9_RAPSA|nr:ubiquitin domain-containing protein DSK2a isoform X1 [Raphanus sativus]XP_056854689.1 ubiquitin domain-containing protein DSK2a-like isoform X1 [Raphanus sativus]
MVGEGGESNEPQTVVVGGEVVDVNVRCSNGSKFSVRTSLESTVESFKALLAQNCDVPANQQRLIYKGRILKDDDHTLLSYGVQADHALDMARVSAPSTNARSQTTSPSVVTRGVQQLAQNPNIVMMNAPSIQNNPELLRTLIRSNPRMRELVDRNPELGHILNDPSFLRQSLQAARNPELMREMTRNNDRALSNIEATPEGFNMLRRMYEDVQEPLMNVSMFSGNDGNGVVSNPFAARARDTNGETGTGNGVPNTNPLPNPWVAAGGQTTRRGRTNSGWDVGAPVIGGIAGLGGLGMLGGDPTVGATPDASQTNQFLQNPAMSQMMRSLLSDPQYMNQMMSLNPQLRSLMDSSPRVREMMQNPEFLRMLSSPDTMQQMMSLQQSLLSGNWSTARQAPGQTGATTGTRNNGGLASLMNMFGSLGAAGGLSGANQSSVPSEELYATQLQQLEEMGFFDRAENIRALRATNGNVNAAVERLLGSIGQ